MSHPPTEQLDVRAVLAAAEAVSSEMDADRVIESLLRITFERTAAERGKLILIRAREPQIVARASLRDGRFEIERIEEPCGPAELPELAVEQVARTRQSLIVQGESATPANAGSTLWLPLFKQSELSGLLCLECCACAPVAPCVRLQVLEFLASLAAITLENAALYHELKRSEATLAEAQQISNVGSWIWNLAKDELSYSEQNYRIHGFDPREAPKPTMQRLLSRIHPDDIAMCAQGIERARKERITLAYDYRIVLPDGAIRHLQSAGHAVLNAAGEPTSEYIGTTADITDRRRAEDALRDAQAELLHVTRATSIGEFAASIAHEVTQPLTGIVTNAQACLRWLAEDNLDVDRARAAVERIIRDSDRTGEIIRSVRGLLRRSASQVESLAINALIREVLDLVRSELRRNAVTLVLDLSENVAPIQGDRVQLQQVIVNLVMNGIEALHETPRDARRLRVRTERGPLGDVLVAVEDSGVGIDPARLQVIFDAFVTSKPNGMGMGLSICRSIVAAHGGSIWATSRVPHGSILQFTLPTASDATPRVLQRG